MENSANLALNGSAFPLHLIGLQIESDDNIIIQNLTLSSEFGPIEFEVFDLIAQFLTIYRPIFNFILTKCINYNDVNSLF